MNIFIADHHEFEQEQTLLQPLLCKIQPFGERVYRFPHGDSRKYYTTGETQVFNGLTTYINFIPQRKGADAALKSYEMKHGNRFEEELNHAADYGTFCHMAVAQFLTAGTLNLGELRQEFRAYCMETGMPIARFQKYWYRVVNDLKAFAQFAYERKIEPLATEYPVYSREHNIATPLDLVCKMEWNRKIRVVNINFKFRENPGVYDKDIIQTNIERFIYNMKWAGTENECEACFIWSPKNWKTSPTFALTDTTGKYTEQDWKNDHDIVVALAKRGKVDLNTNLDEVFTTKTGGIITLGEEVVSESQTLEAFIKATL